MKTLLCIVYGALLSGLGYAQEMEQVFRLYAADEGILSEEQIEGLLQNGFWEGVDADSLCDSDIQLSLGKTSFTLNTYCDHIPSGFNDHVSQIDVNFIASTTQGNTYSYSIRAGDPIQMEGTAFGTWLLLEDALIDQNLPIPNTPDLSAIFVDDSDYYVDDYNSDYSWNGKELQLFLTAVYDDGNDASIFKQDCFGWLWNGNEFIARPKDSIPVLNAFYALPLDLFSEMTVEGRYALVKNDEWTIPGGDSLEQTAYRLELVNDTTARILWTFTTGQRGFVAYELALFSSWSKWPVLVLSQYGGHPTAVEQQELEAFRKEFGSWNDQADLSLPQVPAVETYFLVDSLNADQSVVEPPLGHFSFEENRIVYTIFPKFHAQAERITKQKFIWQWNGKAFIPEEQ